MARQMEKKFAVDSRIKKVVEEQIDKVRPIMHAHNGGVDIVKVTDSELILKIQGHCAGCPMAPITFGLVLEKYIREALPSIQSIKYVSE